MAESSLQPDEPEQKDLAKRESDAEDFSYTGSKSDKTDGDKAWQLRRIILRKMSRRKRTWVIGGAIGAAIAAGLIALFLSLLPLKILHVVSNLQNHFYASAENATQKEANVLLSNYLRKYVLPAAKNCPRQITKSCNPIPANNNPVNRLYKGWRAARLEDKLSTKFGLEFGYNPTGKGHYYLRSPLTGSSDIDLRDFENSNMTIDDFLAKNGDPTLKKSGRAEIRLAVNTSLENETLWKRTMYKYKIGRLLEQKYGIKRCITKLGCKLTDKVQDTIAVPKKAAQSYVAQRVLKPRSEILATVFECLYIDPNCDPVTATVQPCAEGVDCASNGDPQSETDRKIRTKLDSLVASFATDDAYKIFKEISDSGGIGNYIVKQVVSKAFGTAAGESTSKALPVIGWINLAAQVVSKGEKIGPEVQKLTYVTNAASMVQLFSTYRTYADEIKSGNVSAEEVGSFTDSLGPSPSANKGGTASAEESPLYQNILGGSANKSSNLSSLNPFGAKTYAASKPTFLCDNNMPPTGLICPEEGLTTGNGVTTAISNFFNSSYMEPVKQLADAWNQSIGKIFGLFTKLAGLALEYALEKPLAAYCNLPGPLKYTFPAGTAYCKVKDIATGYADRIMNFGVNLLIPNPFSESMSGGRTFDLMAGGADVSGNDYAHNGLGGKALSSQESTAILNEQNQQRQLQYQNKPLVARLFDKESDNSLVTKVALAMPSSLTEVKNNIANLFSLKHFGGIFTPLFNFSHATAAPSSTDPFGVQQYGYTDADIQAIGDPEKYWDAHCADSPVVANGQQTTAWNNAAAVAALSNPDGSYMPKNTETNPCLLILAATGSVGAKYDDNLLTADDLGGTSNAPGGPIDCNAPGFQPGDWSKVPDNLKAIVEANAPTRTSTACGSYPNAHPSDPTKMFFGDVHYGDGIPGLCNGSTYGPPGGYKYPGRICFGVKWRNPPNGSDSRVFPIDGGGSSASPGSSSGSTKQPSGGVRGAQ